MSTEVTQLLGETPFWAPDIRAPSPPEERCLLWRSEPSRADIYRNAVRKAREYNATTPEELEKRKDIIKSTFGSTKNNFYIEPTIKMDYGFNIHIGENFYANFDCVFLDVAPIIFGDNVFVAP